MSFSCYLCKCDDYAVHYYFWYHCIQYFFLSITKLRFSWQILSLMALFLDKNLIYRNFHDCEIVPWMTEYQLYCLLVPTVSPITIYILQIATCSVLVTSCVSHLTLSLSSVLTLFFHSSPLVLLKFVVPLNDYPLPRHMKNKYKYVLSHAHTKTYHEKVRSQFNWLHWGNPIQVFIQ